MDRRVTIVQRSKGLLLLPQWLGFCSCTSWKNGGRPQIITPPSTLNARATLFLASRYCYAIGAYAFRFHKNIMVPNNHTYNSITGIPWSCTASGSQCCYRKRAFYSYLQGFLEKRGETLFIFKTVSICHLLIPMAICQFAFFQFFHKIEGPCSFKRGRVFIRAPNFIPECKVLAVIIIEE